MIQCDKCKKLHAYSIMYHMDIGVLNSWYCPNCWKELKEIIRNFIKGDKNEKKVCKI